MEDRDCCWIAVCNFCLLCSGLVMMGALISKIHIYTSNGQSLPICGGCKIGMCNKMSPVATYIMSPVATYINGKHTVHELYAPAPPVCQRGHHTFPPDLSEDRHCPPHTWERALPILSCPPCPAQPVLPSLSCPSAPHSATPV